MDNPRRIPAYYSHWIFRLPLLRNYRAIVLGRRVFFKIPKEEVDPVLWRHEMIHQEQMDRHTVLGFYVIYLKDYVLNIFRYRNHDLAYRNIPFEREAFERQGLSNPQSPV